MSRPDISGRLQYILDEETRDEVHRYLVRLRLEKAVVRSPEAAGKQFEHVLSMVSRCAQSEGWRVLELTQQDRGGQDYERNEHIRLAHDAVVNHVTTLTAWRKDNSVEVARSHILLKGKPAGAKTTLFERFKKWYEAASPGAERVTFVDMQTATKAGVENWLLDKAEQGELADIVVFEELEKLQPLDNLLPLVSLMGSGYISKLNARIVTASSWQTSWCARPAMTRRSSVAGGMGPSGRGSPRNCIAHARVRS
jgi:hypothetical protein